MLTGARGHVHELRRLAGELVITPGLPGWDQARAPWQAAVDQRPAMVAFPADADDVAAVLAFARRTGLCVAPQGTGHNAAPLGPLGHSVLLRTTALAGVAIDPRRRRARVGAGVLWDDVVAAAAEHGLAPLAGSSPDVGVAGYSLGGGVGWLARRYGLQANRLTAVELVTPDGLHVRADEDHETELFWALRGGGGNFGVVTALEFDLVPLTQVYAGTLVWDWRYAGPVLLRWSEWARTAPDHVTTSARILQIDGQQVVMIDGAYIGDAEEAAPVLEPLRRLRPLVDTFAPSSAATLLRMHGDPEGPTPFVSEHRMLDALPPEAVEAFVLAAGPGSHSPLMIAELRQLGGALARTPERHGALPVLDGEFMLFAGGSPGDADAIRAHARRLAAALEPWSSGSTYLNFAERPTDARTAFAAGDYVRLRAIRTGIDPHRVLHANHPIDP